MPDAESLMNLGARAKVMSNLFGIRETVTHVPRRLRVQLLDPLVRDASAIRGRRELEDAAQPVIHYHHDDHRESRRFDGILPDGTLMDVDPHKDAEDRDDADDDHDDADGDGWQDEGERRERAPPADTLLLLNGVDADGRTVCVNVKGMRYCIYVLCPNTWGLTHMSALASAIEGYYAIPSGGVEYRQKRLHHMLGWEPAPNDPTRTKAHNYCVLGFGSARVMEWAANAIQRGGKLRARSPLTDRDMRALRVYERRVDPVHKALERLGGLQPCSWFDVERWRVPGLYHTHAQIEVEVDARDIVPRPEIDAMAPVWKASWDVECYSHDGSFPRADHPRDCDHTICINTYFSQHRSDGQPPRVVQTSHHFGAVRVHRQADRLRDNVDDARWGVFVMKPTINETPVHDGGLPGDGTETTNNAGAVDHMEEDLVGRQVYVMQCDTELEAIEGWRDLIVLDVQPSVVEGYNTDAFDFGWLGVRAEVCAGYGIRSRLFEAGVLIGEHTPMRRKDLDSAAKGSNTLNFIPMPGRILIDMYHIVKAEKRLESYTLDDVCRSIFPDDETLRKIDVPPEEIFRRYASGDPDERAVVVEYCARDCRLPLALEEHLMTLTGVVEMARITRTPLPLMLISGQQVKTWSQIVYEAHTMGYVVNLDEGTTGSGRGGDGGAWLRGAYGVGARGVGDEWLPGVIAMASMRIGGGNADGHVVPEAAGKVAVDKNGVPVPKAAEDTDGYVGATVLQPRAGYYVVPIVTLDYQSLYPSIMEANNLCPSTRVVSAEVRAMLARYCREVQEPISEIRRSDGAVGDQDAAALNRVFASRPDWVPGQFAAQVDAPGRPRTVAYREVRPTPSRTHVFVQHVQGVVPRILTALKNQRKKVRADQKAYEKGTPMWGVYENRQLGIKITANCFPAEDHEILTESGFMNYSAVVQHFEHNSRLSVACYVDGQLQYHDISKTDVISNTGTHRLVQFEANSNARERDVGNGVSLCCTDNHRIYARVGPTWGNRIWPRKGNDSQEEAAPPFTIQSAGDIVEAGARDPSTVAQFAATCAKGVALDRGDLPFVEALGLRTEDQVDAFIELYGYWLGDGWLDVSCKAIAFSPVKTGDSAYLAALFARLPLPMLTESTRGPGADGAFIAPEPSKAKQRARYTTWTKPHCHYIYTTSWWRYFAEEYGHKYSGAGLECAMERALRCGSDLPARRRTATPKRDAPEASAPTHTPAICAKTRSRAAIAERNRNTAGINERICLNNQCALAGAWQPLEASFARRAPKRTGGKESYDGKCKRCMSEYTSKHRAAKRARLAERYDAMAAANTGKHRVAPDAEDLKSAKWMWSWVWRQLGRDRLRLLLRGLRMADGDTASGQRGGGAIYTSSRRFADEIVRVALHAGYTALIRARCAPGDVNGANQNGTLIVATAQNWVVNYSDFTREAQPKITIARETSTMTYHGTVWCVNVPVEPNLIIVRRIVHHKGVPVPSRALVVGNSGTVSLHMSDIAFYYIAHV
nr:DNA polymerase type-B [Pandoravirus aubagnensis]